MGGDGLTFADLLDDAAFMSLEHQLHMREVLEGLGEHRWDADLAAARLWFTGERGALECSVVHLLGSAAPGPGSWLWSWANRTPFAPPVVELATALRDFGTANGIAELASPDVPFAALPGSPTDPVAVAGIVAEAAKAFSGRWVAYTPPAGGAGTRAAFLLEHPSFELPAPEPSRITRVLTEGLAQTTLSDHRRAVNSYAYRRGLGATFSDDGSSVLLTGQALALAVGFDAHGRIESINGALG